MFALNKNGYLIGRYLYVCLFAIWILIFTSGSILIFTLYNLETFSVLNPIKLEFEHKILYVIYIFQNEYVDNNFVKTALIFWSLSVAPQQEHWKTKVLNSAVKQGFEVKYVNEYKRLHENEKTVYYFCVVHLSIA